MDLRIFIEPQQGARYVDQLRVAKAAEDLGFDAFFRSDHYQFMGAGDGLPGPTDSWVTLGAIARETRRIRLGTLVNSATFRLPGPLAVAVAQVDEMSHGRAELGIGTGWFEAEHATYGIPFPDMSERFARLEEQVEILHGFWTTPVGETYTFHGTYYDLTDSLALPKPEQQPHPPLVMGGAGKRRSATLAAKFADEYNAAFSPVQAIGEVIARVKRAADEAGRELVYSVAHTACVGKNDDELQRRAGAIGRDVDSLREGLGGTPAEVVDRIGEYAAFGATRIYLQVLDLSDLDHLELIASDVMSQV